MAPPIFLFAPGAGAPSSHPWMQRWGERLAKSAKSKPSITIPCARAANGLTVCRKAAPDAPIFVIGKSMGGRIGCHLALEETVAGVVCYGCPLCAMGDRTKLRDQVLLSLGTSILFVQGTRDALCPLDLLEPVRARMTAPNFLHLVAEGDHSLGVSKRQLKAAHESQDGVDRRIFEAIAAFVNSLTSDPGDRR